MGLPHDLRLASHELLRPPHFDFLNPSFGPSQPSSSLSVTSGVCASSPCLKRSYPYLGRSVFSLSSASSLVKQVDHRGDGTNGQNKVENHLSESSPSAPPAPPAPLPLVARAALYVVCEMRRFRGYRTYVGIDT